MDKLYGVLSPTQSLKGTLSDKTDSLIGILTIPTIIESEKYTGEYEVIPETNDIITLETKDKLLKENITVFQIPKWETSNESGTTIYIGKDGLVHG